MQDLVYEALECLGGIMEVERHAQELEETERSNHRCFGISCGSTSIWWYARMRSILEMLVPWRKIGKSCMCGMGNLSGTEAWLSA